jgi:hypothetical protein
MCCETAPGRLFFAHEVCPVAGPGCGMGYRGADVDALLQQFGV